MSTLEDLDDMERERKDDDKKKEGDGDGDGDGDDGGDGKDGKKDDGDTAMADADQTDDEKERKKKAEAEAEAERKKKEKEEEEADMLDDEILNSSTRDIIARRRLLENDTRIMKSEFQRLTHEKLTMHEKIKDNQEKIENNRQLPYLVGNVVEILDLDVTAEAAEEGANIDLDATRVGKSAVIKTSTRQTIFLPLIGLVDYEKLKPGDLIGVNKDSYLVLDTLPAEYDSRVKAMEVDEKPTEKYTDVGGLDKQIEELVEAVVWPMKEAERFKKIGIKAPKGTLALFCFLNTYIALLPGLSYINLFWVGLIYIILIFTLHYYRSSHVRPTRDRQNTPRTCLRRSNRRHLPQARRSPTRTNVHRRWCQTRP